MNEILDSIYNLNTELNNTSTSYILENINSFTEATVIIAQKLELYTADVNNFKATSTYAISLEDCRREIVRLENIISNTKNSNTDDANENARLLREIVDLQRYINRLRLDNQKHINELLGRNESLNRKIEELTGTNGEIQTLNNTISLYQQQLNSLQIDNNQLNTQFNDLVGSNDKIVLDKIVNQRLTDQQELMMSMRIAMNDKILQFNSQISMSKEENRQLHDLVEELKLSNITNLQRTKEDLNQCRELVLQQQIEISNNNPNFKQLEVDEIATNTQQIHLKYNVQIKELRDNVTNKDHYIKQLNRTLDSVKVDLENQILRNQAKTDEMNEEIALLKTENDRLVVITASLDQNLNNMTEAVEINNEMDNIDMDTDTFNKISDSALFAEFKKQYNGKTMANIRDSIKEMFNIPNDVSFKPTRLLFLIYTITRNYNNLDVTTFLKGDSEFLQSQLRFIPSNLNNSICQLMQTPPYFSKYNMYNYCLSAKNNELYKLLAAGLASEDNFMAQSRKNSILVYSKETITKFTDDEEKTKV